MRSRITVSIPEELRADLDEFSRTEGVSRSSVIRAALRDHLFICRFRAIRKEMVAEASRMGIFTDQDVFDRVS